MLRQHWCLLDHRQRYQMSIELARYGDSCDFHYLIDGCCVIWDAWKNQNMYACLTSDCSTLTALATWVDEMPFPYSRRRDGWQSTSCSVAISFLSRTAFVFLSGVWCWFQFVCVRPASLFLKSFRAVGQPELIGYGACFLHWSVSNLLCWWTCFQSSQEDAQRSSHALCLTSDG